MKNKEKFAKEILDIACSGSWVAMDKTTNRIRSCHGLSCNDCGFGHNCKEKLKEWSEAEYEEPRITIPTDTPVDAKVLVSNDGHIWLRRHFAGFDGDLVSAWLDGKTSWTVKHGSSNWLYGKLAEDDK